MQGLSPKVKDQNTHQISSDDSKVQKLLSCIEKISEKKFSLPIDRFHSALKTSNSNRSKASRYIDKVIEEKLMNRGGQDTSLAVVNYKVHDNFERQVKTQMINGKEVLIFRVKNIEKYFLR